MADKPILFSAPMVRALIAGTKTQTRRAMNPQPALQGNGLYHVHNRHGGVVNVAQEEVGAHAVDYLRIAVGDRLYVREHWRCHYTLDQTAPRDLPPEIALTFVADGDSDIHRKSAGKHRQAMHMPRWASRITLTVTNVRVERLQDISRDDAMAEGIVQTWGDFMGDPPEWAVASINRHGDASGSHIYDNRTSAENYRELWNHINGAGSWDANPWVAAYTFTVQMGNIDQLEAA